MTGGVNPGHGSVLDVMADIMAESPIDTQIKRWRASNSAQGFASSASMHDSISHDAASAGQARAAAPLLGGLGSYASMSMQMGATPQRSPQTVAPVRVPIVPGARR